jgi:hypothetical protein
MDWRLFHRDNIDDDMDLHDKMDLHDNMDLHNNMEAVGWFHHNI